MQDGGDIASLRGLPNLFEITAPFANSGPLHEEEILLEASPFAVVSHYSALIFHGLTEQQPNLLTATGPRTLPPDSFPIDTVASDWENIALPGFRRRPDAVLRTPVRWVTATTARFNGFAEYQPFGTTIRVTTPERSLVDGLQSPELSGGIDNVLRAWAIGARTANLDRVVEEVERYDVSLLRQRAGYVLERLGLGHPALDRWAATSRRGGSSRLVGTEPFAPAYDERWNLSINVPIDVLEDDR